MASDIVLVSNLPPSVSTEQVKAKVEVYGALKRVAVCPDGAEKSQALLQFHNDSEVNVACNLIEGRTLFKSFHVQKAQVVGEDLKANGVPLASELIIEFSMAPIYTKEGTVQPPERPNPEPILSTPVAAEPVEEPILPTPVIQLDEDKDNSTTNQEILTETERCTIWLQFGCVGCLDGSSEVSLFSPGRVQGRVCQGANYCYLVGFITEQDAVQVAVRLNTDPYQDKEAPFSVQVATPHVIQRFQQLEQQQKVKPHLPSQELLLTNLPHGATEGVLVRLVEKITGSLAVSVIVNEQFGIVKFKDKAHAWNFYKQVHTKLPFPADPSPDSSTAQETPMLECEFIGDAPHMQLSPAGRTKVHGNDDAHFYPQPTKLHKEPSRDNHQAKGDWHEPSWKRHRQNNYHQQRGGGYKW